MYRFRLLEADFACSLITFAVVELLAAGGDSSGIAGATSAERSKLSAFSVDANTTITQTNRQHLFIFIVGSTGGATGLIASAAGMTPPMSNFTVFKLTLVDDIEEIHAYERVDRGRL